MHQGGLSEEWLAQSQEKNKEAQSILERYCFSGGFVISDETEKSIKRILNSFESPSYEGEYEYHDRVSSAILKEVQAIKQYGARELNIEHSSSPIKRRRSFLGPVFARRTGAQAARQKEKAIHSD